MKKRILSTLLLLCLILSGCTQSEQKTVPKADIEKNKATDELMQKYLSNLDILETPTREYGESTGYIQFEEDLKVRILYPDTNIASLDEEIEAWVEETVTYYQKESEGSHTDDTSAELTAEYDSYIVNDEWISVKITGLFDKPYIAHPIDIIATFHANQKTGNIVTLDELLTEDGRQVLTDMVIKDANLEKEFVDEQLLDNWALTSEGLEITLERGKYLAMSEGTVILNYSYEKLEDILAISIDVEKEKITDENHTDATTTPEAADTAKTAIDPNKPMVALTFDDGPSQHTDRLLTAFATHGGKGTFFVVGNLIDDYPDTMRRMSSEGHEIAGHSWNHRQLTNLSNEELTDQIMTTRAKIYDVTGTDTTAIRPPYGAYNDETKSICSGLGIIMVNWSLDTLDWKDKDTDRIYNTIMNDVKDGDIILCHDLHGTTVDAMERVIPDLQAKGYQLVTVTELLSYSEAAVEAGNVYTAK